MRLVMGVSADGFVSKGPKDKMEWLGLNDKKAFQLLTVAGSGVCGGSARTLNLMPMHLKGRQLVRITRTNFCLEAFAQRYGPDCTLLGGQTLAIAAFEKDLISAVHLCRSDRECKKGQEDLITLGLQWNEWPKKFFLDAEMRLGDTNVETWRTS